MQRGRSTHLWYLTKAHCLSRSGRAAPSGWRQCPGVDGPLLSAEKFVNPLCRGRCSCMDPMWKFALLALAIAAGIVVAARLGQRLYSHALLRRLRFGRPASRQIDRSELPDDVRLILDDAGATLHALGFEYVGSQRITRAFRSGRDFPLYSDDYLNRAARCFASVIPAEIPEPGVTADVSFQTLMADGRVLVTVNRRLHHFFPMPANYLLEDGYLPGIAAQWALHRQRAAAEPGEVVDNYRELRRRDELIFREMYELWQSDGFMEPAGDGHLRLTRAGGRRFLHRVALGNRMLGSTPAEGRASREALVAADLHAYHANQSLLEAGALGRLGKLLLFALSMVAGVVAFGLAFSWEILPVLLGVLLFHEFGHALAMLATGHRNVQVLVIPLLGAVAAGRKDDAGPWTRLLVLLAGPLPGLVVAVICLHAATGDAASNPLLLQVGMVALVLNLFNLLPITPLDGGQIVETFLFARWPRLRFVFFLASLVALGALGLWLHSEVMLGLSLLLAVGTRSLRRRFWLAARIGPVEQGEAPRVILRALHELPDRVRGNFQRRLRTIRSLLPLLAARPAHGWETVAGLAVYLAAIALPLAFVYDLPPAQQILAVAFSGPVPSADTKRDWDREVAEAESADERWKLLMEAGAWEEDGENYKAAHRRYQQALAVAQGFPVGDLRLLDIRIALARTGDWKEALPRYRELLDELRALEGKDRIRLAMVLEELYWLESESSAPPVDRLREAIAIRSSLATSSYEIAGDHGEIARILYRQGNMADAETELRSGLAAFPGPYQAEPLIWLLIDRGRGAEAEALIREYLPRADAAALDLHGALVWALLDQGRTQAAREELKGLLKATEPNAHWLRVPLLLDLVHVCGDSNELQTRWREQAREEITRMERSADNLAASLRFRDEFSPWLATRTAARLSALGSLELPPSIAGPPQDRTDGKNLSGH